MLEHVVEGRRAPGWRARPAAGGRRPGGSAGRAGSRRWARGPRRWRRPPAGGRSSAPACPPSGRAWSTCPCRSGRGRPGRARARCRRCCPRRRGSTAAAFMSALRAIGPASIEVWISSPVRSRKPVLMNTIRSLAACTAAARLSEVRRSSSIRPILSVFGASPSSASTRANSVTVKRHLVGPVLLGLDDVDRPGPAVAAGRVGAAGPGSAPSAVTMASRMPSKTSAPSASRTASVVIRWPTFRTSSSARPGRVNGWPAASV